MRYKYEIGDYVCYVHTSYFKIYGKPAEIMSRRIYTNSFNGHQEKAYQLRWIEDNEYSYTEGGFFQFGLDYADIATQLEIF